MGAGPLGPPLDLGVEVGMDLVILHTPHTPPASQSRPLTRLQRCFSLPCPVLSRYGSGSWSQSLSWTLSSGWSCAPLVTHMPSLSGQAIYLCLARGCPFFSSGSCPCTCPVCWPVPSPCTPLSSIPSLSLPLFPSVCFPAHLACCLLPLSVSLVCLRCCLPFVCILVCLCVCRLSLSLSVCHLSPSVPVCPCPQSRPAPDHVRPGLSVCLWPFFPSQDSVAAPLCTCLRFCLETTCPISSPAMPAVSSAISVSSFLFWRETLISPALTGGPLASCSLLVSSAVTGPQVGSGLRNHRLRGVGQIKPDGQVGGSFQMDRCVPCTLAVSGIKSILKRGSHYTNLL